MWITTGLQADWMCLLANTSEGPPHRNKSLICLPMKTKGVCLKITPMDHSDITPFLVELDTILNRGNSTFRKIEIDKITCLDHSISPIISLRLQSLAEAMC